VAMFKVGRGFGGRREMAQVATPEEGKSILVAEEPAEVPVKVEELDEPTKYPIDGFDGGPAYRAMVVGITKQSVPWARAFIKKLKTEEEVDRLTSMEKSHPKFGGGRKSVLAELAAQGSLLRLGAAPDTNTAEVEVEEEKKEFVCDECDFIGGSEEGLEAHISAVHDL